MLKLPGRTLADWTPEAGGDDWLARWQAAGWVPEHSWGGTRVVIDGRKLTRWAMIKTEPAARIRALSIRLRMTG